MVASDRISAFDWVFPTTIPDKGRVLTQVSKFWFDQLGIENHFVSEDLASIDLPDGLNASELEGRSMIVKKCEVVPIECVIRGYLVGSGWRDYQATGKVCGIELPQGLPNCAAFDQPIFTPATKADSGHDENISFASMAEQVGEDVAEELRQKSLDVYLKGSQHARNCGIILADTKLEWGWHDGNLILIDEVLTPDSSRFWPVDQYEPGRNQPSFDKQFVREYLETTSWDKNSPPPELPQEIVDKTRAKYVDAFERLTGTGFAWS
jgi:phosphoribosylaminoimidazole-succinocarboxamide synthase